MRPATTACSRSRPRPARCCSMTGATRSYADWPPIPADRAANNPRPATCSSGSATATSRYSCTPATRPSCRSRTTRPSATYGPRKPSSRSPAATAAQQGHKPGCASAATSPPPASTASTSSPRYATPSPATPGNHRCQPEPEWLPRGTGRTTTREPAIGPIKSLTDTKNLLLPLDEYMLSLDDYRHLAEARGILTRRCMERFGINYQAPTRPGTGLQTRNERRYGITDLTEARRYGYRQPQGSKVAPPPSSEQDRDPKVTAILVGEGARAFTSRPVPPGGCAGEAQRRLRASEQSAGVEDIAEPLAMKSWALSAD